MRSKVHVPSSRTTSGVSTESIFITTIVPFTHTGTTAPLVFGTVPQMTRVIAIAIDVETYYSTVMTTVIFHQLIN